MQNSKTNEMKSNDDNDESVCSEVTNLTWGTKATTRTMSSAKLREIDALFEDLLPGTALNHGKPIEEEEENDDQSQDENSCALPYEKLSKPASFIEQNAADHDKNEMDSSHRWNKNMNSRQRNYPLNSTTSTTTSEETATSSSSNSSQSNRHRTQKDDYSSSADMWSQPNSNYIDGRTRLHHERNDEEFSRTSIISSKNNNNNHHLSSHFLSQRRHRMVPGDSPSISENTTGMSSILESMGLSNHIKPNSTDHENKHFHSNQINKNDDDTYHSDDKYKKKNTSVSLNNVLTSLLETDQDESITSSSYMSKNQSFALKKSSSSNKILSIENIERRRQERQMNLRASVILVFFLGVLLFAVQFDTAASTKKHILIRGRHQKVNEAVALRAKDDTNEDKGQPPKIQDNIFGGIESDKPPKATPLKKVVSDIPPPLNKNDQNLVENNPGSQNIKTDKDSIANDPPPQSIKDSNVSERNLNSDNKDAMKMQGTQSMLPIENLGDINVPDLQHKDLPLFWNIPRSGGSFIKTVLTVCQGAILASEAGIQQGHDSDQELKVVTILSQKYVNVDVSTSEGINRAKSLGLAQSGLADVVVTAEFQKSLSLFDESHHGRAFTLLRHPIERAASVYSMLVQSGHQEVSKMSLEEYARSPFVENNWMVRFLSGNMNGEVTEEQTNIAKDILRTKFIVGLLEHKGGSLRRLEDYFGWTYTDDPETQYQCRKAAVTGNVIRNESAKQMVTEGTQAWNLLAWQNKFDLELYEYGKNLYQQQGKELFQHLGAKKEAQKLS